MLSDDEARTAYRELLEKLRALGANELVSEIDRAVGAGRVQERKPHHIQEPLPATSVLEIALRMLAAWIEPAFLVSETEELLREASGAQFDGVRWLHDRLDIVGSEALVEVVESEARVVEQPIRDQDVLPIPSLGTMGDELRGHIEQLHAIAEELGGSESR